MNKKNLIKNEKNYYKINQKLSSIIILFLILIIIKNLMKPIVSETNLNKNRNLQPKLSIDLKIYSGYKIKIINKDYLPNRIYINGIKSSIDKDGCINAFSFGSLNEVTIEWDNIKPKLEKIFQNISDLIEIDLSNIDTSDLISMERMFINCHHLQYINFTGVDTSLVTNMESMFENCYNLESLNLISFDTTKVNNMNSMFKECYLLTSLNLTNFNSKLKQMNSMFYGCQLLSNLLIPNIDTSSVTNMDYLFYNCFRLTSLEITNFDTKNVKSMDKMFYHCNSLLSIDLSKMDTSNVINMNGLFADCNSLISLDLSNFHLSQNIEDCFSNCISLESIIFSSDLQKVKYISRMFFGCSSLKSIDLSSFDLSEINSMESLFKGCSSLTSLDLSNINIFSPISMDCTFCGCHSLKEIKFTNFKVSPKIMISIFYECISLTSLDLRGFDTSFTTEMSYAFYNCNNLISLNLLNFNTSLVTTMVSMFEGCHSLTSIELTSFDTSNVNSMIYMFKNCRQIKSLDLSSFNVHNVKSMYSMFLNCTNLKYINIYNSNIKDNIEITDIFLSTSDNLIICIKEKDSSLILPKLHSNQCIINNCSKNIDYNKKIVIYNRKCLDDCKEDELYKYTYDNFCYDKCPKGSHYTKENKYLCEINEYKCIEDHPFLVIEYNICREECSSIDFFDGICKLDNVNNHSQSLLIKNIRKGVQEGLMNDLIKKIINEEKKDIIKKNYNIVYQITTVFNQNNNEYKNLSTLNLGELENIIKEEYNILSNDSLIIFKMEKYIEGLLFPLIEYEIFNPETKEIIDLTHFKNNNLNITIYIPISININNLYKYEKNSSYYNDICYTYTTERGTDLTLFDRQNEFNINNYSLCYKNCIYNGYDIANKKVICRCDIEVINEKNKDEYFNKFLISMKTTNFNIVKCYKLLFSKEGLIKNAANYIILFIIILIIISAIYFYFKGYNIINDEINQILAKKNAEFKQKKNFKKVEMNLSKENSSKPFPSSNYNLKIPSSLSRNINSKDDLKNQEKSISNMSYINQEIKVDNKNEKIIEYMELEMNSFKYKDALINDKRNYFQFYISLIKEKHILFFTFNINKNYNSFIIKICFLFFSFSIFIVINAFFFNDSTFHRIYLDYGKFNFVYILPHIIYSIIISSIINEVIKKLSLFHPNIIEIKNEKNKYNLEGKSLTQLKCIIIKLSYFFVFSILLLIIFWYYLSCFCAVYKNTQIYFIKSILIGYILSLIYPFIFFLFPGLLRIPAIKCPGKCLYKISQFIQFW